MSAPQLSDFVTGWTIATSMGALFIFFMSTDEPHKPTTKKCLVVAALIVGFAVIAAAVTAGIYHAEWIDYRRAVAR